MRFSAFALFASGCAAQFSGMRVLSYNATASNLDINDLGGSTLVSYAYDSLMIGSIKQTLAAEPFLFFLPPGAQSPNLQFESYHVWDFNSAVRAVVDVGESKPVRFINLDSDPFPSPESSTFAQDENGYLIQSGENKFFGCRNETTYENSYVIFWLDNGIPEGYNCTEQLYLTTANGCSTIG
ncbi:hypothetical protein F5884DRAFT_898825 [Xylogone sp. PMI_703]|nr:hypothetical protein F5884DRAFT_898825 [Xylogone sp. PMI_703]